MEDGCCRGQLLRPSGKEPQDRECPAGWRGAEVHSTGYAVCDFCVWGCSLVAIIPAAHSSLDSTFGLDPTWHRAGALWHADAGGSFRSARQNQCAAKLKLKIQINQRRKTPRCGAPRTDIHPPCTMYCPSVQVDASGDGAAPKSSRARKTGERAPDVPGLALRGTFSLWFVVSVSNGRRRSSIAAVWQLVMGPLLHASRHLDLTPRSGTGRTGSEDLRHSTAPPRDGQGGLTSSSDGHTIRNAVVKRLKLCVLALL